MSTCIQTQFENGDLDFDGTAYRNDWPSGSRWFPQTFRGACLWNFGDVIAGVTRRSFGRDAEYGTPDTARFGGTLTSKVLPNPALAAGCRPVT